MTNEGQGGYGDAKENKAISCGGERMDRPKKIRQSDLIGGLGCYIQMEYLHPWGDTWFRGGRRCFRYLHLLLYQLYNSTSYPWEVFFFTFGVLKHFYGRRDRFINHIFCCINYSLPILARPLDITHMTLCPYLFNKRLIVFYLEATRTKTRFRPRSKACLSVRTEVPRAEAVERSRVDILTRFG